MDIREAMESAMAVAIPETLGESADNENDLPGIDQPEPVVEVPEKVPESVPTDAEGAESVVAEPKEDEKPKDEEPAAPVIPEGMTKVPAITDALATEFIVRDAEGEIEIPALTIEYKANGKVRKDRLDQVVKLAQWGVYNHERETRFQSVEQEKTALETALHERETQLERLLTDDEFLLAVREAYEAENSPEKRVERAESQVKTLQVQQQMQEIQRAGDAFADAEIYPAVELIADALPYITKDELYEKVAFALQAQAERAPNGELYVPASRYDAVRKYIVDELAVWAQFHNQRRKSAAAPAPVTAPVATGKEASELTRARVEAQKAKRIVGQTLTPVGRTDSGNSAAKSSSKPATVDDAFNSAMESVMAAVR
jgi:hypothetical protein